MVTFKNCSKNLIPYTLVAMATERKNLNIFLNKTKELRA
jgi:hypothetical protein